MQHTNLLSPDQLKLRYPFGVPHGVSGLQEAVQPGGKNTSHRGEKNNRKKKIRGKASLISG